MWAAQIRLGVASFASIRAGMCSRGWAVGADIPLIAVGARIATLAITGVVAVGEHACVLIRRPADVAVVSAFAGVLAGGPSAATIGGDLFS